MFPFDFFAKQIEKERRFQFSKNLLKDIRFDIGTKFTNNQNKKMLWVKDIQYLEEPEYIEINIVLIEHLPSVISDVYKKEKESECMENEILELLYKQHYSSLEEEVRLAFSYLTKLTHQILIDDSLNSIGVVKIGYSIQFPFEKGISLLSFSRKIKKSIDRLKKHYVGKT